MEEKTEVSLMRPSCERLRLWPEVRHGSWNSGLIPSSPDSIDTDGSCWEESTTSGSPIGFPWSIYNVVWKSLDITFKALMVEPKRPGLEP